MERLAYDADAQNQCAVAFAALGQLDVAEPLMQRAFRLNPFAPADYHADRALLLMLRGDAAQAEEHFDVARDPSLFYRYARLINMLRLPELADEQARLAAEFTAGFARAWQLPRPATLDDLRDWLGQVFPLRLAEHAGLLTGGLAQALGPDWRAAHGSAR